MRKHIQGVPKKIVDSELFTPGDDNNTQQQDITSGPIFVPFCDILHPFFLWQSPPEKRPFTSLFYPPNVLLFFSFYSQNGSKEHDTYIYSIIGCMGGQGNIFQGEIAKN